MLKLAELSQKVEEIKDKAVVLLEKVDKTADFSIDSVKPIRLVFAGQYSAGKSSIIKMLTGNKDIEIGAGITTQETHTYNWNGLEVVDTPGIHTQLRPDHDEISYEAITSADMLVFVITNELFDDHIAKHFRSLAIDKDKAGEMLLVVNKMERTSLGNVSEQQEIIREDLRKVLDPYTPEQMYLSFVDAESFLASVDVDDKELSVELKQRSGYEDFINTLNAFVHSKSIGSRLTTTLYEIDAKLEECIEDLQPKSEFSDIDALEENFMQQRHELFDSRNRLQQEIRDIFANGAMKLRALGMESAGLITETCKQDEVEHKLEVAVNDANEIIDACQDNAIQVFETRMNEIGQAIEAIEHSEFSQKLIASLEDNFDKLPDNVKSILQNAGGVAQQAGEKLVQNAYKGGVQGGLKLANFSGGNAHNLILKAGHAIGYKFKPWQAVKMAKGVAVAGQVLGILGVGLSVFMQIKEDHDEDKLRDAIRNNRQNIRGQFYTAASELEDHGTLFIEENVILPLDSSIQGIDENISEIRNTRTGKTELCIEFEALQKECQELIKEIHNA